MKYYFYSDGGKQKGPLAFEQLKDENIDKDTLVWFEGLTDWKPAKEINALDSFFQLKPPPIPNYNTKIKLEQKKTEEKDNNLIKEKGNSKPYEIGNKIKFENFFSSITYKQFIADNKLFIVFYLIWFMFNFLMLVTRVDEGVWGQEWHTYLKEWTGGYRITDSFWPIGSHNFSAYDLTEFWFYLITPIVLLGIWKLISNDVKKYIKDYKLKRKSMKSTSHVYDKSIKPSIPIRKHKKSLVVALLIVTLLTWLLFYTAVALMEMQGKSSLEMVKNGNFLLFILRIATVITLTKKSKEIEESKWTWGIFGFLLPPVSLLVMLIKLNKRNKIYKKYNS